MIRVLIADDHTIFRAGLRQILNEIPDITALDEASNGKEILARLAQTQYDVILLDISMPGESGVEVLKQIKHVRPEQAVLILSMHPEEQYALRILRAGALGYLTKESAPEELIAAIRKVAAGGRYISSKLGVELAMRLDKAFRAPRHEILSDREYQVMIMIASGKTIKEIAEELPLSVSTINTYRTRVLEKMDMKTNVELTRYAIQRGLVG
ncbi:MAG: response regulator [Candidatus Neomarinimicrobiota bacterium]